MYPRVCINLAELKSNCEKVKTMAENNGISIIMPVLKVAAGDIEVAKTISESNFNYLADSRVENLKKYCIFKQKKVLLRLPSISEVAEVISYSDLSLNSELKTILALDLEAKRQNKKHEIIFMFDIGDLREGVFYKNEYIDIIETILSLKNIVLKGIGTNLTCYGGLVPSTIILNRLVDIKSNIESKLDYKLEIISGGNSSSVFLFGKENIPTEINSLRLGEVIFFGKETAYSTDVEGLHHNIFTLEAEVIESQFKPSYPDGEMSINSFGEKVNIEDKGIMKRLIIAIGKQDVIISNIFPVDPKLEIIGGSSDHLIVECKNADYQVGDIVKFEVNYPGLLHLMNSSYVKKVYK